MTIRPHRTLEIHIVNRFASRFAPQSDVSDTAHRPEKVFAGSGSASDPYVVDWLPDEPANPYNWNRRFKWILTAHLAINCLVPVFISSSYVAAVEDLTVYFPGTSIELGISGLSLYLVGRCIKQGVIRDAENPVGSACGPLFWAPLSEIIGRRLAFLVSFPVFVLFNLAGTVSQSMASILVTRFFAGVFGSPQISNLAGQMGDLWIP